MRLFEDTIKWYLQFLQFVCNFGTVATKCNTIKLATVLTSLLSEVNSYSNRMHFSLTHNVSMRLKRLRAAKLSTYDIKVSHAGDVIFFVSRMQHDAYSASSDYVRSTFFFVQELLSRFIERSAHIRFYPARPRSHINASLCIPNK